MNSKMIGNIGEAQVLAEFVSCGIPVYIPFGDNEKADLIAEFNGKLNKIQVKTSVKTENGSYIFSLQTSSLHRKNGQKRSYTKEEIDYFALYNLERQKVLLIPVDDNPPKTITVRFQPKSGGGGGQSHFEEDMLLKNVLCVETLHDVSL